MFVFTAQWVLQGKAMMRQGENKGALENWVPDGMYRRCSEMPGLQTATQG